jgi:hypothetical protein
LRRRLSERPLLADCVVKVAPVHHDV